MFPMGVYVKDVPLYIIRFVALETFVWSIIDLLHQRHLFMVSSWVKKITLRSLLLVGT